MEKIYSYISVRACYDPVKTIIVCPPSACAESYEKAEAFAKESGWEYLAEYDEAALIIPIVPKGWENEDTDLPVRVYEELRNNLPSLNGKSLWGRGGKLWCWETMIYLVGYEDGADFAGSCVVAAPGCFAASALIGGGPKNFEAGDRISRHWFVKHMGNDYAVRNKDIPCCVWFVNGDRETNKKALAYFKETNGLNAVEQTEIEGISVQRNYNAQEPAAQILISENVSNTGLLLSRAILSGMFDRVIRWKTGPDGTLRIHLSRQEFYTGDRFIQHTVTVDTLDYPCAVHLPRGMKKEEAKGLPLLFSVHGRGEPAWLFAEKNGWDILADETREFVLAVPDSPGNIWNLKRDGKAFGAMIDMLCSEYGLDRTRVYLTGFSNGAAITREVGTAYPQWFAGLSPWNGPTGVPGLISESAVSPELLKSGYEMPYWVYMGDQDPATAGNNVKDELALLLKANRCEAMEREDSLSGFVPDEVRGGANYYTKEAGYEEGDRFYTEIYRDLEGNERVGLTVMKDMPHGAIEEQSKAAWMFLRKFSRPGNGKNIKSARKCY